MQSSNKSRNWQSPSVGNSLPPLSYYIYIYIYIYIYNQLLRNCFVVSPLFSVTRPERCIKSRSKPCWFYVSQISYSRVIVILIYSISYRNAQYMKLAIAFQRMWQPANFSLECSATRGGERTHTHTHTHTHTYIYIYIYIYIYCHPLTDCFVLSELFSVARPAGRSKPGSKPVQLYDRLRLQTTRLQADYVG